MVWVLATFDPTGEVEAFTRILGGIVRAGKLAVKLEAKFVRV